MFQLTNEPERAEKHLKAQVKAMKKGDQMLVFAVVSRQLEKTLNTMAKKNGATITFAGTSYNCKVTTVESRKAEHEDQKRQSEALRDYYNSPG